MVSRKILLAHGRYGPEEVAPGYIVPVYVAVAKKQIGNIRKGQIVSGVWSYDLADARVRLSDWNYNNSVPAAATRIVKAYVVSYGGPPWRSTW